MDISPDVFLVLTEMTLQFRDLGEVATNLLRAVNKTKGFKADLTVEQQALVIMEAGNL
jgi:hypothetical protein